MNLVFNLNPNPKYMKISLLSDEALKRETIAPLSNLTLNLLMKNFYLILQFDTFIKL